MCKTKTVVKTKVSDDAQSRGVYAVSKLERNREKKTQFRANSGFPSFSMAVSKFRKECCCAKSENKSSRRGRIKWITQDVTSVLACKNAKNG